MQLKPSQVQNISTLIHFMRGLNDPRFDMSSYAHDCNTPACALGWACTLDSFRTAGLPSLKDLHTLVNTSRMSRDVEEVFGDVFSPIFGAQLFVKIKTPQEWADHASAFLRAHGYDVVPADDGFKAFMEKALQAVALERA